MSSNKKQVMEYLEKKYPKESSSDIIIINLDGQILPTIDDEIKKYLETFQNVEELTMSVCKLHSLENFPDLPKLSKLELSDNYIKGDQLSFLKKYKNLTELRMVNNPIKSFDELKPLEENFKDNLKILDLSECPLAKQDKFFENLKAKFPNLKKQDDLLEEDEEDEEEENEEDNKFIESDKKNEEGNEEVEGGEEEDEEEGEDEKEEGEGEEEEDVKNPNPSKKRKLE